MCPTGGKVTQWGKYNAQYWLRVVAIYQRFYAGTDFWRAHDLALRATLGSVGIKYIHLKELGGLRPSVKSSINKAWRNKSFRNYADYMQTEDFQQGIEKLMTLAEKRQTAIMCAEAVPWCCHRSLVSDALLVRGVKVYDIMSAGKAPEHRMTPFAVVRNDIITYPNETV